MATSIGGINVGIGVNIAPLIDGLSDAERALKGLEKKFSDIRLKGLVFDDRKGSIKDYFKTASKEIDSMFKSWSKNISEVPDGLNKWAKDTEKTVLKIKKAFEPLKQSMDIWQTYAYQGGKEQLSTLKKRTTGFMGTKAGAQQRETIWAQNMKEGMTLKDAALVQKAIVGKTISAEIESMRGMSSVVDKELDKLNKYLQKKVDWDTSKVNDYIDTIKAKFKAAGKDLEENKYVAFGEKMKAGLAKIAGNQTKSDLYEATNTENILKSREAAINAVTLASARARAESELGINVDKNRAVQIASIQALEKLGVPITDAHVRAYKNLIYEKNRVKAVTTLEKAEHEANMRVIKQGTNMLALRNREEMRLREVLEQANMFIKKRYEVEKNSLTALDAMNEMKRKNIALSTQELQKMKELEKQRVQLEKAARIRQKGGIGEWLESNAMWFIKLRAFWEIYRQLGDAITGALQFEQAMAEVRAVTQAAGKDFEMLKKKAVEVGLATRFSGAEAAQGMVAMGQAGLSAKEIMEALVPVTNLASATMFDLQKTSELTVSVMRAWGYETKDMTYIADVLATSISKTRLTMQGLSDGMSYISAIAPQLNISLEDSVAMFGQLANRGISFSIAATSIRAVLSELLNPTDKFVKQIYKLGLSLSDVDPKTKNIIDIFDTLKRAGWGVAESFAAFERRAATGAAVLIQSSSALRVLAADMYENERAAKMAAVQLDTVSNQWKQFKDTLVATVDNGFTILNPAIILLIDLLKSLTTRLGDLLEPLAGVVGLFAKWAVAAKKMAEGTFFSDETLNQLKKINDELRNNRAKIEDTISAYIRLKEGYENFQKTWKKGLETKDKSASDNHLKNAVDIAHRIGLISREELPTMKKLLDSEDGRQKLEATINERLKEQISSMEKIVRLNEQVVDEQRKLQVSVGTEGIKTLQKQTNVSIADYKDAQEKYPESDRQRSKGVRNLFKHYENELEKRKEQWKSLFSGMSEETLRVLFSEDPSLLPIYKYVMSEGATGIGLANLKPVRQPIQNNLYPERLKELSGETEKEATGGTRKSTKEETRAALSIEKEGLHLQIRRLQLKRQEEKFDGTKLEDLDKVINNIQQEYQLQIKIANTEAQIELNRGKENETLTEQQKSTIEITKLEAIRTAEQKRNTEYARLAEQYAKSEIADRKLETNEIQKQIDMKEKEINMLMTKGVTSEDEQKAKQITDEIYELTNKKANLQFVISDLSHKELANASALLNTTKEQATIERAARIQRIEEAALDFAYKKISLGHQKRIYEIEVKEQQLKEDMLLDAEKEAQLQKEIADAEITRIDAQIAFAEKYDPKKVIGLEKEKLDLLLKQRKATLDLARAQNPLLDAAHRLVESNKTWQQMTSDQIVTFSQGLGEGIGQAASDAMGGFQTQKQEVINLTAEYDELNKELQELKANEAKAISDNDIEKTDEYRRSIEEVTARMRTLQSQIEHTKDPINNLKESFRLFFKDLIDGIREAVMKWAALQLVIWGVKAITGAAMGGSSDAYYRDVTSGMDTNLGGMYAAEGGVLPHIKSFRSFSSGGITGNPTLALLGDNKSGRELVIPEENINKDHVSGYTRDTEKQPINVVNILTKEDIANSLAGIEGERLILNHIGRDLAKNGPIYRQLRV